MIQQASCFITHIHFMIPKNKNKITHKKAVNALMNYILQKWCLYCSRPKNCVTISPHSAKKGRKRRNTHTQSHNKGPCNTHTQYRRIGLFEPKPLIYGSALNGNKNHAVLLLFKSISFPALDQKNRQNSL